MQRVKRAHKKRRYSPYLFICLCIIFALLQVPGVVISEETGPKVKSSTWSEKINQNVTHWIAQIQEKDSRFSDWKNASFKIQALGPGSKQWLVIITNNSEDVGYLIVGLNQHEDFVLIEYGKGLEEIVGLKDEEQDMASQHHNEEIGLIYSGLLVAMVYDHVLHDLITGEAYEHVSIDEVKPFWFGQSVNDLVNVEESKPLHVDPIVYYGEQLPEAATFSPDTSYIYIAGILPKVTALYKVLGWHQWDLQNKENNTYELYIGLENESIRFFSYSYLKQLGTFQSID